MPQLYLHSDDYINLYERKNIIHFEYIRRFLCYYILVTLDKPFISIHPICGKIETTEVLIAGRGLNCLCKFKYFPKEVYVFSPLYLDKENKKRCKNVLAIANLYEE